MKGPKILRIMPILLLPLLASALTAFSQGTDSIYEKVYRSSDLPTGGEFVQHPANKSVIFYFTNRQLMWSDKANAQKHSGLYRSTNGGETWTLLCYFFEFKKLFIHPDTDKLYAIIRDEWLAPTDEGFLVPHIADKAIMSSDGKHWRDIMGKQKHVADLLGIFADPDNPGRVCLQANVIRSCVLQAIDDNYTEWKWYKAWDWPKRHELMEKEK